MNSREEACVSSWPESVQYLFTNYAQSSTATSAISSLRALSQEPTETERELSTRLNKAIFRCGNVYPPKEVPTPYIHTLHPATRTVVVQYGKPRRRAIYLDIVDFPQYKVDAVRTRTVSSHLGLAKKRLERLRPAVLLQCPSHDNSSLKLSMPSARVPGKALKTKSTLQPLSMALD